MGWTTRMGTLALVALSGTAGWMLHGLVQPAPPPAAVPAPVPADPASRASLLAFPAAPNADADADRVELHPDGSTSIQVRQRAPSWVLAELCRQGARGLAGCGSGATPVAAAPASGAAQTLSRLKNPDEQARLLALMQARDEGQMLPEGTLQALMASDPSEQVRMEAFDSYIERHSGTTAEMRAALQAVLRIPDAMLQTRAREQLDELDAAYRNNGAVPQ